MMEQGFASVMLHLKQQKKGFNIINYLDGEINNIENTYIISDYDLGRLSALKTVKSICDLMIN